MVVKGIIEEVLSSDKIKVRCPTIDKIKTADLCNNELNTSVICNLPGTYSIQRAGDVVFVGFENNNFSLPVVLGYLFLNNNIKSLNSIKIKSLVVNIDTILPKNTSIGKINWYELNNLSGLSNNLSEVFEEFDNEILSQDLSINDLKEELNSIYNSLNYIKSEIELNSNFIDNAIGIIGNFGDTSNKTLFGKVKSIISKIDLINERLGNFSKENTLENQFNKIDKLIEDISNYTTVTVPVVDDEQNCMLARAEKMVTVTWVPKYSFNMWNSSEEFKAGQQYMGMPYTLWGYGYTYDAWKEHAEDNTTISGYASNYGERSGPKYGSCCADFVSEVLALPVHSRNCDGIKNQIDYLETLTEDDAKSSNVRPGDVLWNSSHVMWVGSVDGDTITIYEQTVPLAHKFNFSISNDSYNGYVYHGYEVFDTILRPTAKLLSLPDNQNIDTTSSIKDDWVYKGNKIYGAYSDQALTDKEYINNALIFWKICKKAGWTAEAAAGAFANTYAESTGNPWSYGTGGGGIFGFTPFDEGTKYNTGVYDYAQLVLKDANKRWDGNTQVDYVNWQIKNVIENNWTSIFCIREPTSRWWNYTPPNDTNIPKNDFGIDTYIKLDKKHYGATPTICAKLWLARYEVVDTTYPGRILERTILNHTKKAEELYQLFIKY